MVLEGRLVLLWILKVHLEDVLTFMRYARQVVHESSQSVSQSVSRRVCRVTNFSLPGPS